MKTLKTITVAALGLACLVRQTPAANEKPSPINIVAKTDTATEANFPKSEFKQPRTAREGRDPFFPTSSRPHRFSGNRDDKSPRPAGTAGMVLRGVSGTPQNPLAVINNQTFAKDEEGDLILQGGYKIRIHVLDIGEDRVTIEVDGQRQELRLRARF